MYEYILLYNSNEIQCKDSSVILGRPAGFNTLCSRMAFVGQRDASICRLIIRLKK